MMDSANIIPISKDYKITWEEIKKQINKIPLTPDAVAAWKKKVKKEYYKGTPGIILQEKFDITDKFREIKINVVWGEVINFKYYDEELHKHIQLQVDESDKSLFCLYQYPPRKPPTVTEKCEELKEMLNWNLVIPKIEKFAHKLHLDYVRIDIFPRDKTNFYINEIEVTSSAPTNFHDEPLEKLKVYSQVVKESKNPEQYFLDPKLHDLHCDVFDSPYVVGRELEVGIGMS